MFCSKHISLCLFSLSFLRLLSFLPASKTSSARWLGPTCPATPRTTPRAPLLTGERFWQWPEPLTSLAAWSTRPWRPSTTGPVTTSRRPVWTTFQVGEKCFKITLNPLVSLMSIKIGSFINFPCLYFSFILIHSFLSIFLFFVYLFPKRYDLFPFWNLFSNNFSIIYQFSFLDHVFILFKWKLSFVVMFVFLRSFVSPLYAFKRDSLLQKFLLVREKNIYFYLKSICYIFS